MIVRRSIPAAVATTLGFVTLLGLLFNNPSLTDFLLGGASFLAAIALLLGIVNLFLVHLYRILKSGNPYSLLLILTMAAVFTLGWRDIGPFNLTDAFITIQAPLEAAFASMLSFFLLFAALQLWQRQKSGWSALFLLTIIVVMLLQLSQVIAPLPANVKSLLAGVQTIIDNILVVAGVRGLLIGIAIGTILISLRLLVGLEQPYNK